jgi:hypothetical protein
MKKVIVSLFILGLSLSGWSQSFDEKVTTSSRVRLNVTNVGTFGNAFRGYRDGSGTPSCEYPAGSGIEHLFESGIWIAANPDQVSTAAYDAPNGYATGGRGFEMTVPVGSVLNEKSTLFDSPNYATNAISQQDFIADFTDSNVVVPGTNTPITDHNDPLNIGVHMEAYNWNYAFSDFFVIVSFDIVNYSNRAYDSMYVSLWSNTVVRNVNVTPAGSGGSAFYSQGGNGYSDSLNMAYCWDVAGDVGFTESYIGQKFLGADYNGAFYNPQNTPGFNVHYNTWQFNSGSATLAFPTSENARYQKMTRGLNFEQNWDQIQNDISQPGNRSDLVSAGPFYNYQPGDTISLAFAFIMGEKKEDGNPNSANTLAQREIFYRNADWAQTAYLGEDANGDGILTPDEDLDGDNKIDRYILPTPPDIPKTKVVAEGDSIQLYWSDNSESSVDPISLEEDFEGYRVYLSKLGFDVVGTSDLDFENELFKIAEYDLDDNGIAYDIGLNSVRLEEPYTSEGETYYYKYTINDVQPGWQYAVAVTSFDRGEPENNLESLESSPASNLKRVFTGTPINDDPDSEEPFAYPNPYYSGAAWEGASNFQEESRKMYFANLPAECVIRVFTPAGDLIDEIRHDQDYNGSDIRWFQTFGAENPDENVFSGGIHAWDLLSQNNQIISRGLYLFTVEDLGTGKIHKGKFMVIK